MPKREAAKRSRVIVWEEVGERGMASLCLFRFGKVDEETRVVIWVAKASLGWEVGTSVLLVWSTVKADGNQGMREMVEGVR